MAYDFIKVLKYLKIDFLVSPYEADAQLTFLNNENLCDSVITLDSDLLAFGIKRGFYKTDMDGNGDDIDMMRFTETTNTDFSWMNEDDLLNFCILCGCDYLTNIPGLAFKRVNKLFKEVNGDVKELLVQAAKKREVDADYFTNF